MSEEAWGDGPLTPAKSNQVPAAGVWGGTGLRVAPVLCSPRRMQQPPGMPPGGYPPGGGGYGPPPGGGGYGPPPGGGGYGPPPGGGGYGPPPGGGGYGPPGG